MARDPLIHRCFREPQQKPTYGNTQSRRDAHSIFTALIESDDIIDGVRTPIFCPRRIARCPPDFDAPRPDAPGRPRGGQRKKASPPMGHEYSGAGL
jgi:hypothetical protein